MQEKLLFRLSSALVNDFHDLFLSLPPTLIPDSYTHTELWKTCFDSLLTPQGTPSSGSSPDVIITEIGARVEARNPPFLIKKLSQALDFTGYLWTIGPHFCTLQYQNCGHGPWN